MLSLGLGTFTQLLRGRLENLVNGFIPAGALHWIDTMGLIPISKLIALRIVSHPRSLDKMYPRLHLISCIWD